MEKTFNFLKNLSKSLFSLLKILFRSNLFLKQTYHEKGNAGKQICILGNGPSLKITVEKYIEPLNRMELLAVNNMVSTDYFTKLKPVYYIMPARTYFYPDTQLSQLYIDMNNLVYKDLEEKVQWKMTLLIPTYGKHCERLAQLSKNNPYIQIQYYNATPIEGLTKLSNLFFSLNWGMPRPHNVVIPSLMNLIWLGYKEIYIVGADHSWLKEISVNEQNEALVNQKHFYDEGQTRPMKMEDRTQARKLHEIIEKFFWSFRSYWELKPFAEKKGVKIYNASEESMIDAFERKKLS